MKLTVHTMVKNEDIWIGFAINSVLPFADRIIIYDTGSTDKTVEVIRSIKSPKIVFEEKGAKNREELAQLRQEMIDNTKTDWFLILDGDEIWPQKELEILLRKTESAPENIIALFNRTRNCVGDVFHYQEEEAGKYKFADMIGNLTIRMIRKTPDLKLDGKFPLESYSNTNGPIQDQSENIKFADCWYLHTTFLRRSSLDRSKTFANRTGRKFWEKGLTMKREELPEVLLEERTDNMKTRGLIYEATATVLNSAVRVKRRF